LTGILTTENPNWPSPALNAVVRWAARRELPHPGAQLSLFEEADGLRYQLFATNTPTTTCGQLGQIAFLEARHRAQAHVEDCIRNAKNTGLNHLPSKHAGINVGINQAWPAASAIACDLLAWLRLLCLSGDLPRPNPRPCATGSCTPQPHSGPGRPEPGSRGCCRRCPGARSRCPP
jgi:hypothetical protein